VRVVGGQYSGHGLSGPKDRSIRPSSDRLRGAVFDILAHSFDDVCAGARVLDLFAGTGALGIEALSRGARSALFIDQAQAARGLIRQNLDSLGIMGLARISKRDVTHLGPAGGQSGFTLVFIDPPYGKGLGEKALTGLVRGGWLAPDALIVLEEASDTDLTLPDGFVVKDTRRYGDSQVVFLSR
jgi:16S rRNA (guanine966-N2)-methyltransferase